MNLLAYIGSGLENFQFTENIFLVDILDIVIIALFIYIGLFFLKQTRSLATFAGVIFLIIIYSFSRIFNLHLTAFVLQSFFGAFLVILAIVFQDELRRFFQLLAMVSTRQTIKKSNPQVSSPIVSSIVQAAFNLAREKRGALIIIPGQEMIERFLEGGQNLDGLISQEIIESIFDPDSSGHDGAMIISKDRIIRFGAHLPLSKNFKQIKGRGTRHSAALGISEKTDALAIVVSEERGEISIAKNGKLKTLKDYEEIENNINSFLKEKFPQQPLSFFENIIKKNTIEKISAIAISFLLWFLLVFQVEIIQRDFVVPISYRGIPDEMIIKSTNPSEVTVTLAGRGQASFASLDSESLSIILDGKKIEEGVNNIEIERGNIRQPFNLSVVNINPSIVQITAQEFEFHTLPIRPDIQSEPEELRALPSPESIRILVPKNEAPPNFLTTEIVNAEGVERGDTIATRLIVPPTLQLPGQASRDVIITFRLRDN